MAKISLRAAKAEDLPRLRVLWRESFGEEHEAWFFRQCFVPGHVESSLVLLEDGIVQSMVFLLPAFWYSGAQDRYAPAPCLVGLATDPVRRHQNYAGWLVETACDFLVEKGAGGVWTLLPDNTLELFSRSRGSGRWGAPQKKLSGPRICRRAAACAAEVLRRHMSGGVRNSCKGAAMWSSARR